MRPCASQIELYSDALNRGATGQTFSPSTAFHSPHQSSRLVDAVSALLNRVQASHNGGVGGIGILVWGVDSTGPAVKVTVYDSIASANSDSGFFVTTRSGYAA